MLVEIHGQQDDRGLFDSATHRRLLDAFGGHEVLAAEVAGHFAELARLREDAAALRRAAASAAADAEFIRYAVDELLAFAPEEGEEARLASERSLLMNANRIAEDISAAVEALGGERGAESSLASVLKRLTRLNEAARKAVSGAEAALEQAFASAEEGRRELEALLSRLDADPGELERKEERLFGLRAMARKYAVTPDALPGVLAGFVARQDAISGGGGALKAAEAGVGKGARGLSGFRAQTLRRAQSLGEEIGKRGCGRAHAAEIGPCEIPRGAGGGRRQRQRT